MMKLKRVTITLVSASIVVMAGLVVLPNTAFASSRKVHSSNANPATLYVASSGTDADNNCKASINPCQTINFALTLAQSGATIMVQAGTYDEQVKITHPVTIIGAGSTETVIKPSAVPAEDGDTDTIYPQFYIVDVSGTTGVNLKNIGINGSAATASLDTDGDGCGQDFVGVYYHDASGSMTHDAVTGIEMPADLFGCQGGLGVYAATDSGSPTPSVLNMSSDNINNYDKNGITCDDPGTVCNIKKTTVTGIGSTPLIAQNGIQIWGASAGVTANVITDNTYDGPIWSAAGILIGNPYTISVKSNTVTHNDTNISLLQDQSPGWDFCGNLSTSCPNPAATGTTFAITANHVSDATNTDSNPVGSEFGDGIDIDSVTQPTTLTRNVVDNNPGNGISLLGATSVTARRNSVRSDYNGFFLSSGTVGVTSNADTLQRNTVSASLNDGILATSSSGDNMIVHNSSQLNGNLDASDSSVGAGTAGTANTWEANDCQTSDPSGLCHPAASPVVPSATGSKGRHDAKGASRRATRSKSDAVRNKK
jgi:parallel beta-helix repeat protein